MTTPAEVVYYVTVQQVQTITYRVTSSAEGITDETTAQAYVETADTETLDAHETHMETSAPEVTAVEVVDERPTEEGTPG